MRRWVVAALGFIVGADVVMLLPDTWIVAREARSASAEAWACPMLCVRLQGPGTCPVCGMALERIAVSGDQVAVSEAQAQLMGLRTAKVERRTLTRPLHAVGAVDYSDRRIVVPEVAGAPAERRLFAVRFDVYDAELPWLRVGQRAEVVLDARPGEVFAGVVESIEGGISTQTRSTRARVAFETNDPRLTPGMLASVTVHAVLGADGRAADPQAAEAPRVLALPREAVLATGARHLVYHMRSAGVFERREVRVGATAGPDLFIAAGLGEGDVVAAHGAFLLDSQLQLAGQPSLLVP